MTKYIKAVKGNVSAVGRLFSEGVASLISDEVAGTQEIIQMEKLGYLMVFETHTEAIAHSFTGIAALARSGQVSPLASTLEQSQVLKAEEAKAKAVAAAEAKAAQIEAEKASNVKLTAAEAKAAAQAAPTSIEVSSTVTNPSPVEEKPATTTETPATPEK